MGGFTVSGQTFREFLFPFSFSTVLIQGNTVSVDQTSQGLLDGSVSGIMGLAFSAIASTKATPWWQSLANNNQFTTPEISFWLTRFLDQKNVQEEEPGGALTLGGTNSTLFTGDIEFLDLKTSAGTQTFWLLDMSGMRIPQSQRRAGTYYFCSHHCARKVGPDYHRRLCAVCY